MKAISAALAQHLAGEVTTWCRCWKLVLADGGMLGFTEHDSDVVLADLRCEAETGLDSSMAEQSLGFATDSMEVAGALSSQSMTSSDIRAGRYDGARLECWIVNWRNPAQAMLDRIYNLDQITERDGRFHVDLRSQSASHDETRGRRFSRNCDAQLGDARCGVNTDATAFSAMITITAVRSDRFIEVSGLEAFEAGWFRLGSLAVNDGQNGKHALRVLEHLVEGDTHLLKLWAPAVIAIEPGWNGTILAGCDKSFATCRRKFSNSVNFRGFPHIPGIDFAFGTPGRFSVMDGGALVP
ncbi:MAG: DUF2163 domain-containing protein [Rhizobiaceae bacterium]